MENSRSIFEYIAAYLKERRAELGLTQEQVAKKAEVSKATLWKLENFDPLSEDAKEFNVSMASLNTILTKGLDSSFFEMFTKNKSNLESISNKIENAEISIKSKNEFLNLLK